MDRNKRIILVMSWVATSYLHPLCAQMPVNRVVITEAKMLNAPATITVVGTVEPFRRSRVSAEIAGLVQEMPTREGDSIEAQGSICQLNRDTIVLRLEEERARLASLQARHEELLAGTRPEELTRLQALFDETLAEYERWQFEMTRIEKLYQGRDSNAKEYNDTRAEFRRAERRRIAANAAYDLAEAGPRQEVIAQAAFAVAQQHAVVKRIETDLRKTNILAPFSGFIVERMVEIGEWIDVGDPVVEVVDLSKVLVSVQVPETALPFLKKGADAGVKIDALKRYYTGQIKHIMRQADRNARTFPVKIEIANQDGLLAAGMFARVTLPAGPEGSVLAVPKDSVLVKDGVSYVGIIMPGREGQINGMLTPVTLGTEVTLHDYEIRDWVSVTSGRVQPGSKVVIKGTERILPFPTPVEIVDDHGTPVATPLPTHHTKANKGT